ncbi:MAG: hypothetical protein R3199_05635 [Gemmatimonadota bacterium]|nr:hypothetical protein [Gemmatimonadota bacterium]
MRIRAIPLRLLVVACTVPWLAFCSGEQELDPGESPRDVSADTAKVDEARARIDTAGAVYGGGGIANGGPMPPAEQAGGIPPYPDAVVWTRAPRDTSEYRSLEAFTPDSVRRVITFYDSLLPGWTKRKAKDTVIYEKPGEEAAVTVQQWDGDKTPPGSAEPLKRANTAIGTAWRR